MTKCAFNEICSRQTDFEAGIACFLPEYGYVPAFDSGLSIQKISRNRKPYTFILLSFLSTKVFPTFIASILSDIYKVLINV